MGYIENPKTKSSGIICAIPQKSRCPNNCADCFFQSGRSYLEPLKDNLPNMPPLELTKDKIVRINDGNDSNVQRSLVIASCWDYKEKFYNTSIPYRLGDFDAPVVLTLNPGKDTDEKFYKLPEIPKNLMFVRFRTNMWNTILCDEAVQFYSEVSVPIVLTFMAYFKQFVKEGFEAHYTYRKRVTNPYWAIITTSWESIMLKYKYNKWVYSCGKIEGEKGVTGCRYCGNCLREYFATKERMLEQEVVKTN